MATKKKTSTLRSWDGPTPLSAATLADIKARLMSYDGHDHRAVLTSDCTLLVDEVDRLEYELTLAHDKLRECQPKKRRARKRNA